MEKGVNNFRNFNSKNLAQLLITLFQVYLISFLKEKSDKNEAITARFVAEFEVEASISILKFSQNFQQPGKKEK